MFEKVWIVDCWLNIFVEVLSVAIDICRTIRLIIKTLQNITEQSDIQSDSKDRLQQLKILS